MLGSGILSMGSILPPPEKQNSEPLKNTTWAPRWAMREIPLCQSERTSTLPPAIEAPVGIPPKCLDLGRLSAPPTPLPTLNANFTNPSDTIWLYGNVTSTSEPLSEPLIGIYRYQLNSSNHNRQKVHIDMALRGFYGNAGWHPDGYHIVEIDAQKQIYTHHRYDLNTWKRVHSKVGDYYSQFSSSAWDWMENRQAALCMSDSAWAIHDFAHFIDMENFERTKGHPIVLKGCMLRAMAIDTDGTVFAIDYKGNLYRINRHDGSLKLIGNTGKPSPYDTSMYIDPLTHKLYYVANNQRTEMYILDTETAQPTYLWTFPFKEQIFGLFSNSPLAYDGAPAAPEELTLDFKDASLTGNVNFRIPARLFSGASATGQVSYAVKIDRKTVATGTAQHGASVSVPVTVDTTGYHTYVAVLENAAGASPYAVTEKWTGLDNVNSVVAPRLKYMGNNVTKLEWDACTLPQHGGFMPATEVTYDVVRYPGAVKVAEGISRNEFSETINLESDEPMACYYAVRSNVRDAKGTFSMSNKITVGAANPPYAFKADTEANALLFTAIDADEDGFTWQHYGDRMVSYHNPYKYGVNRDDWLISAPVNVKKGMSYKVHLELQGHRAGYDHIFSLCGGFMPDAASMTQTWIPSTVLEYDGSNSKSFDVWITPDKDGTYYLGLHATSLTENYYLYLNEMTISGGGIAEAPATVDDLLVYTHDDGGSKAYIGFTAPETTLSGNPLNSIDSITLYRGDKLVKLLENPVPGKKIEMSEQLKRTGAYEYTIRAYNAAGSSIPYTLKTYIGNTTPGNVLSSEADIHAEGTYVTWTPPVTNVSGIPINPNQLTFSISGIDKKVVKDNITGRETVIPNEAGKQRFTQYLVLAHSPGGQSDRYSPTNYVPVGTPYTIPFVESVPNADLACIWKIYTLKGIATWGMAQDGGDINSSDNDGGFLIYQASLVNSEARLTGGRVNLGEEDLEISIDYFCFNEGNNRFTVQFNDGNGWKDICTFDISRGKDRAWNTFRATIPQEYKGKTVQIGVLGNCLGDEQSYLDNIRLAKATDVGIHAVDGNNSGIRAYVSGGTLYVKTADGNKVEVYTASGIKAGSAYGDCSFRLSHGVYIVKCGDETIKVSIR